ncbi:MAG: sigma-70 family RNA polymerase sigma factor [Pelomonas sp.]|nr:sigma-70 family RNA polymerase sigma factor [Roseateles sp.]
MDRPDEDAELVRRAQAGEMAAFEMLVVKYQRRVERLLARQVRDVDLIKDICQESFVRAWRALPGFRFEAAFYTWLYRIAVNTARKTLAGLQRDPVVTEASLNRGGEGAGAEPSAAAATPTELETPEVLLEGKQLAAAANAAVAALPPEFRQAFELRELDGLAYEEIAALLGCPVGTVRSRIFRAREAVAARLRPLLETRGGRPW